MSSRVVRRLALVCAVMAAAAVGDRGSPVSAASRSKSLSVSIAVVANCSISTSSVAFGSFDPVVGNATAPLDASGAVIVACTKGAATTIDLDLGLHAAATVRRMWGGTEYLEYELFQDVGRTLVWGTGVDALAPPISPGKAPRSFTVYGRIPGAQDVMAGSYADTVTATVNF